MDDTKKISQEQRLINLLKTPKLKLNDALERAIDLAHTGIIAKKDVDKSHGASERADRSIDTTLQAMVDDVENLINTQLHGKDAVLNPKDPFMNRLLKLAYRGRDEKIEMNEKLQSLLIDAAAGCMARNMTIKVFGKSSEDEAGRRRVDRELTEKLDQIEELMNSIK